MPSFASIDTRHILPNSTISVSSLRNMQDFEATVRYLEAMTAHTFSNKLLCAEAVQMAAPQVSIIFEGESRVLSNNKDLAILGDVTLTKVVCAAWYDARDKNGKSTSFGVRDVLIDTDDRRTATRWGMLRNDLISNNALAERGYGHGVDSCIFSENVTVTRSPKMVAMALKAIIGAIFQDGGDEAAVRAMEHLGLLDHPHLVVKLRSSGNSACSDVQYQLPYRPGGGIQIHI
jgi:ribonuclease III